MKNIVNRALVAKKKQFQSKSVPRGTRTIWRYLSALILLFSLSIGQMWGTEVTVGFTTATGASGSNTTRSIVEEDHITVTHILNSGTSGALALYTNSDKQLYCGSTTAIYSKGGYKWNKNTGTTFNNNYVGFQVDVEDGYKLSLSELELTLAVTSNFVCKVEIFDGTDVLYESDSWTIANNGKNNTNGINPTFTAVGNPDLQDLTGTFYVRVQLAFNSTGKYLCCPVFTVAGELEETGGGGSDPVAVTGISLAPSSATIKVGKTVTLVPTITPNDATDKAVTWAVTSGSSYASVTDAGVVTGLAAGTAVVTATAHDGSGITQTATITVEACPTSGTVFSMDITASEGTAYTGNNTFPALIDAAYVGGKAYSGSKSGTNRTSTIDSNGEYPFSANSELAIKVVMDCDLAEGDIIDITTSSTRQIKIQKVAGTDLYKTANKTFTIPSGSSLIGENVFYLMRDNSESSLGSLTVTRPIYRTITLEYADGTTADGSIEVIDGTAATKPADPTWAHHRFAGWYNGSDPYNWSETVGGDLTLTAHWTQLYTVTYAAGDGTATGDAPTQEDLATGEKFNVAANTFAVDGKDFVIWNDGTNDYAPNAEYTIGTANVVLTAQWKAASAKYTVHYMDADGTTPLAADELVEVTQKPAGLAEDPTKPLYTFAAWQLSGVDIALDADSWASVVANAEITLTARWAKVYASSYDMEAYAVSDGATLETLLSNLDAAGYAYTNVNGIDYGHTHNYIYDGMKYKTNDGDLSFNVIAGKVVEVKTGYLPSNDAVTMYINGVADATVFESAVEASETHKMNYFYSAAEALYRLDVKASKGTCAVKKVTIRDPYTVSYNPHGADAIDAQNATPSVTLPTPVNGTGNFKGWYDAEEGGNLIGAAGASYIPTADIMLHAQWELISTVNTLSDLKVDGATIEGFDPAIDIYYLVYEYGQQPVITSATATAGALAEVTINNTPVHYQDATEDFWYVQVKVVPESGESDQKFYQVRYTNLLKKGVELIKATYAGGNQNAGFEATGYYGGTGYANLANTKKMNTNNYAGVKLPTGKAFATGDILYVVTDQPSTSGGSEIEIYAEKEGTNLIWNSHAIDLSKGIALPADFNGLSEFYIVRKASEGSQAWNGYVNYVSVERYMNPFIESFKIGEVAGTISGTNIAIELPYGTSLYGVAATIEAYANGGATITAPTPLAYDTPLGYKVSSAYAEDGDVDYTVTITEADHYEAMIVGGANYETLAAAVAAAQADDVVKLLDNVDLMADGLTIAKNMTLDLNGFNIKAGEQLTNDINVPAGVKLTLVDNSENHLGKIYTEEAYTGSVNGYGVIRVAGELLMQSGNIYAVIDSDPANLGQFAVVIAAGGKVTVEGGQIKAGWYAISNNGNNTGSTIIVSGGELISTADFAIYNPAKESTVTVSGGVVYGAAGGIAMNRGELTVTGGTITSKDQGTTGTWGDGTGGMSNAAISASGKYESVEVEISGGTIIAEGTAVMITNGTTNPVEIAISGGQFSHVVPAEYCADGFAPVTTPNAQGKYEVIAAGVIRGAAVQDAEDVYYYTLDNGVTIYSSQSDGRLNTSNHIATSGDIEPCGGDHGGYNVNQSKFVLKFPVNVKEFTLYGANSTERSISKVYDNAEASKDIKISTVGRELTGTYTNTKDGKCQTLTAAFNDENIIPANYYVLVTLSGTANIYRVLYTEAECTTPTVTVADQTAKDGVAVNLTAEASALGATYQWYTCDDAQGTNPVIIPSETAKTLSVTKSGADDQFYKVVVGCNCSAETAEAVAKVSLYTEVMTLVDVTENTVWDWSTIVNDVDGAAITSDGKKVNGANGILANYIQGTNMDKVESNNGAYAIRSNSNLYYQGASLHMHTTKGGILKIHARSDGNTMTLNVQNAGRDIEIGSLGNWKDYTIYVQAGDVVIYNVPETAGKPMRIDQMTFTVKETPDYTRNVSSNYGTLCVEHNVLVGGAMGATFYQIASRNEDYDYKIDFEEVLPNEELKAGEPYLFKSNTGKIELFFGETEAPEPVAVRGMIGNYAPSQLAITEENKNTIYYFAQNKLWLCDNLVGSYLILNEHRAYIDLTHVPTYAEYEATKQQQQNPAPRRRVSLEMNGEKIATGCENLNVSDKPVKMIINGQLFILRGEKMYDAKGQLVK